MKKIILFVLLALLANGVNAQIGCWKIISSGGSHSLGIKQNGTLWAWGDNSIGQLGDSTFIQKNLPYQIGVDSNWILISAGSINNIALKDDGTIWTWGANWNGALGDNTTISKNFPIKVGMDTNWVNISAGNSYCIAKKNNGTIWGWGANNHGQIGDGTFVEKHTPTQIGIDSNWDKINAGDDHVFGIKNDGSLWGWGWNVYYGLGDGTNTPKNIPTQIGTALDWKEVSAGFQFSIGLKNNGTIYSWGNNGHGQLGNSYQIANTPLQIGNDSNWVSISTCYDYALAVKNNGKLYGWGDNSTGGLGFWGTIIPYPTQSGSDSSWQKISDGLGTHTIGLNTNNDAYSSGSNGYGQLGIGGAGSNVSIFLPINCPLPSPPKPKINFLPQFICNNANLQSCFLINPTGIVEVLLDGVQVNYNLVDSSFNFLPQSVGNHNIHISYTQGTSTTFLDTSFTTLALPIISINSNPINANICIGQSIVLTAISQGNIISFSPAVLNSQSFVPSISGNYIATATDVSNCTNSTSIFITVNNPTTSTINHTSCNSYTFNNQALSTSGIYYDTLVNSTGCDSIITLNLTINNSNIATSQNGTQLSATATGATYQWLKCNPFAIISGANSQTYNATANGNYAVIVTQNGCSDTSNCMTVNGVGINELNTQNLINISPNPTNSIFKIECPMNGAKVIVYNSFGQKLLTSKIENLSAQTGQTSLIDISHFSKGIYIAEIIDDKTSYRVKIIKE